MALVTVGNTRIGTEYLVYYSSRWVTAEYLAYWGFIHYKLVMAERSYERKVFVSFYVRIPDSAKYSEIASEPPQFVIPAVFLVEDGTPVELLNEATTTYRIADVSNGWQTYEVPLKRDLQAGEEIWAGVWSEFTAPVWDSSGVSKGTCGSFMIYTLMEIGPKSDFAPYFDNGDIFDCFYGDDTIKGNYSLYWRYYNVPLPKDYALTITTTANVESGLARKSGYLRKLLSPALAADVNGKRLWYSRVCEGLAELAEHKAIGLCFRRLATAAMEFFGGVKRHALFSCTAAENIAVHSAVIPSRFIQRLALSAFDFLDWLKGKIRNENCVVELFTPITVELIIENCRASHE